MGVLSGQMLMDDGDRAGEELLLLREDMRMKLKKMIGFSQKEKRKEKRVEQSVLSKESLKQKQKH